MRQYTNNQHAASRPPGADADFVLHTSPSATTVLVVEDETVVSFFIRTLLEERGLHVAVAATAEALQLIETLGSRLGAAIIDVGLPDTPGDQLVAPIRTARPGPIVIATGFSETEFGRRFQDDGRLRVIGKPLDAQLLRAARADLDEHFA